MVWTDATWVRYLDDMASRSLFSFFTGSDDEGVGSAWSVTLRCFQRSNLDRVFATNLTHPFDNRSSRLTDGTVANPMSMKIAYAHRQNPRPNSTISISRS
jgi:hypothetical protein